MIVSLIYFVYTVYEKKLSNDNMEMMTHYLGKKVEEFEEINKDFKG